MNIKKLIGWLAAAVVVIAVIVLAVKLIGGAFAVIGSLVDALIGLAVLIVLALIVIWMFSYARRKRK